MKDKTKRDKELNDYLTNENNQLTIELVNKGAICRQLIALIKKHHGTDLDVEMFDIVREDHFLRKQI